jgi:hypothetical protein
MAVKYGLKMLIELNFPEARLVKKLETLSIISGRDARNIEISWGNCS